MLNLDNIDNENNKINNNNNNSKQNDNKENYLDILIQAAMNLINNNIFSFNDNNNYEDSEITQTMNSEDTNINKHNNNYYDSQLIKCKNSLCSNYINVYSMSIYCNECDIDYVKGNFCFYCKRIYSTRHKPSNHEWLECFYCNKHNHIKCEMESGNYVNINKMIMHKGFKYMCPQCRKHKQRKGGNNHNKSLNSSNNKKQYNGDSYNKIKKAKCDNKEINLDYIKIMKILEENSSHK
jgi:hypothetical protein